jgi:hypothetical protein
MRNELNSEMYNYKNEILDYIRNNQQSQIYQCTCHNEIYDVVKVVESILGWYEYPTSHPYEDKDYLVTTEDGNVEMRMWFGDRWENGASKVIAWKPRPKPYVKEDPDPYF